MSEFDDLPPLVPRHLRFLGESDEVFLQIADELAAAVIPWLSGEGKVLDFGCGYGRLAYGLARNGFSGHYIGVDVLPRHVGWLANHFFPQTGARYQFTTIDLMNARYNPNGKSLQEEPLEFAHGEFDGIAALDVFIHLPESDVAAHLTALAALLKSGGTLVARFLRLPNDFSLDSVNDDGKGALAAQLSQNAFTQSPEDPTQRVAFREQFLLNSFSAAGLVVELDIPGHRLGSADSGRGHDLFVLTKREIDKEVVTTVDIVTAANIDATADIITTVGTLERLSPAFSTGLKKLHVGCGPRHIWPDWWNVDIRPFTGVDECKDVSQPWAWKDLDYIYSEYFLQALAIENALHFFYYAGNALRHGGVMRLSTPNLRWILLTHLNPHERSENRSITGTFAVNRAFYGWGHHFLWTEALLCHTLFAMGFEDVRLCEYGKSSEAALNHREAHASFSDAAGQQSVVIVECRRGLQPITIPQALSDLIEEEFVKHVRSGH